MSLLSGLVSVFGLLALRGSASTVISPRQYWPEPGTGAPTTPEQCVQESFSNPRWGIYNPAIVVVNGSSGGSQGDIRFLTVNPATGLVANCTANNIELDPRDPDAADSWHNCSVPDLYFQFTMPTLDMRLKGSWSCGNSSKLKFDAFGWWEIPLIQGCLDDWEGARGEETLCIMGNSQVWASLSGPVAIQPQLPILPYTPADLPERCVDRSVDPEWQVEDLLYQHHYVSLKNETKKYYDLSLNLTNISNREKVLCSVTVDQIKDVTKDGSTKWVACVNGATGANATSSITSTSILFDDVNKLLGVTQAWNCSDGIEGIESNEASGTGYLSTNLDCGSPLNLAIFDAEGYVVGATSDYNCSLAAATNLTGYAPPTPEMPHTSYVQSCTIDSVINTTAINLREYQIDTPAGNATKLGTFTLYNPGPRDTYRLTGMPVQDDGTWHDCVGGAEPLPWQLVKCQYQLDRGQKGQGGSVGFKVQWYCDDRDPGHA
ncbi:hypothetical protein B0T17DRAFT_649545 [Bombardia bombarda]|uniref:Uncharacterized protein n=1 Tax=Bombardia bombarda TaxID=252184 RepID=A0AA39XIP0_9PEZI|nr:hypothetical protein B0T17DRAFT_649545 [Bombardia bombarda]